MLINKEIIQNSITEIKSTPIKPYYLELEEIEQYVLEHPRPKKPLPPIPLDEEQKPPVPPKPTFYQLPPPIPPKPKI